LNYTSKSFSWIKTDTRNKYGVSLQFLRFERLTVRCGRFGDSYMLNFELNISDYRTMKFVTDGAVSCLKHSIPSHSPHW